MTKSRGLRQQHGRSDSTEYRIWASMRARCNNSNNLAWADYGGRGIAVCEAWSLFAGFYADMGPRPEGGTLERINNDMGYEPTNCRWATRQEQAVNKRNNVLISLDGETHPLSVWAERFGLKYATAHQRITKYGWTPEQALKTPLITRRKGIPRGAKLVKWGAENGVTFHDSDAEQAAA